VKQVVQPVGGGRVRVEDVPRPVIGATEVLVQTQASLISVGTERALTQLAQSMLLNKARARPDLVRQVVRKARSDGIGRTVQAVRARLDQDLPLGYSAAGIAIEVGAAVAGIVPGQLIATGGAGKANHAEWQAVPALLCSQVPDGLSAEQAAFATVASIALHGLRLAGVEPGSDVAVVGLGLVGQLAARLAMAAGCRVIGLDVAPFPIERAVAAGIHALRDDGDATTEAVLQWARGFGVDSVLVTASDHSSSVIRRIPALCRDRASVVIVGDVGLELERTAFYEKELALRVARSYGPGRYDRSYEEWGVDYPIGQVRWTEGRNQQAVLDLIARGSIEVSDLITHRFPIAGAVGAYDLIESRAEPYLGIVLTYPAEPRLSRPVVTHKSKRSDKFGVGLVGAGAFASSVLVPALRHGGFSRFVAVSSSSGLSAQRLASNAGFERAVSGADAVIEDPDVAVVVIATPHDTHAAFVVTALKAGKHVWCEKPLALTGEQLDDVERAYYDAGSVLYVGFNRRMAPTVDEVRRRLADSAGPLVIDYRVSVGTVPERHWYADRRQGGRLLGEICHFVDTCAALSGSITDARAVGSIGIHELLLADNFVVSLRHTDGSLSAISYAANGHTSTEKERIEILGRGHTATIADFRAVTFDGRTQRFSSQDKGHRGLAAAFHQAVRSGEPAQIGLESSRAVIQAAAALGS
jgi:predicted dehydrogenase/threonine dehydrogenase-like Zn-dependent dehydrogenase